MSAVESIFRGTVFNRLLLSYLIIIIVTFALYSSAIFTESARNNRENLRQRYDLELQQAKAHIDSEIDDAKAIGGELTNSLVFREIYLNSIAGGNPVDTSSLYNALSELETVRGENIDIYEVLLIFYGDTHVYSTSGIYLLSKPFARPGRFPTVAVDTVGDLTDTRDAVDLLSFYKKYFIVTGDFSLTGLDDRGAIFVLFDAGAVTRILGDTMGPGVSFKMYAGRKQILGDNTSGVRFNEQSEAAPDVHYELSVNPRQFSIWRDGAFRLSMLLALLTSIAFMFIAYTFTRAQYNPIRRIMNIVGNDRADLKIANELEAIEREIGRIITERDSYRYRVTSSTPFVTQAVLHALLTRRVYDADANHLLTENGVTLNKKYFTVVVLKIDRLDTADNSQVFDIDAVQRLVRELAQSCIGPSVAVTVYEESPSRAVLVLNTDTAADTPDVAYSLYQRVTAAIADHPYVITAGVGETYDGISRARISYRDALKALDAVVFEGKGSLLFYDENVESGQVEYYFPQETQFRLVDALKSGRYERIDKIIRDIFTRNRIKYDLTPKTAKILLYELYIVTLRSLRQLGLSDRLTSDLEAANTQDTLEEILEAYLRVYARACKEVSISRGRETGNTGEEIVAFLEANCFRPDISEELIAARFHVSTKYVSVLVKRATGMGYSELVHNTRISRALVLLGDRALSVKQVCASCGYSDVLTFRRHFYRIMLATPSEYRRGMGRKRKLVES
jgi:AraC-like DNA-binding protein